MNSIGFAIKPRKDSNSIDNKEKEIIIEKIEETPFEGKYHFKKIEEFNNRSGHLQNKNRTVNLLDFEVQNGSKPTKINILDLSLHSTKDEKTIEENEFKKQGSNGEFDFEKSELNKNNSKTGSAEINFNTQYFSAENNMENFNFDTPQNAQNTQNVQNAQNAQNIQNAQKSNVNDINDFFETINLMKPPKETSKLEKMKESYNSIFEENEASKIDKIYNLFGGPSFSLTYSPYQVHNQGMLGSNFELTKKTSNTSEEAMNIQNASSTNAYATNLTSAALLKERIGCTQSKSSNTVTTLTATSSNQNSGEKKPSTYPTFDDMGAKYQFNSVNPQKRESSNSNSNSNSKDLTLPKTTSSSSNDVFNLFN